MNKEKLNYSMELIDSVISKHQTPVISCSFGRDSTVLVHLIHSMYGNKYPILFINTGVEFPETLEHRDYVIDRYKLKLYEVNPFPENFWGVVKKHGFPLFARGTPDGSATGKCCYFLKKKPLFRASRKYLFDLNFTGIRSMESLQRKIANKRYGDYHLQKREGYYVCHPLMDWTNKEIDSYIQDEGIKLSAVYDKTLSAEGYPRFRIRTGCWACPQGWNSGKSVWMKEHYPGFYNTLMQKGLAEEIAKINLGVEDINKGTALEMLENRPCFFDKISIKEVD